MKAYAQTAIYKFKQINTYKLDVILQIFGSFILIIAMRETWIAIYANQTDLTNTTSVTANSMVTYITISTMLNFIFAQSFSHDISSRVQNGSIVFDLQKPLDLQTYYLFQEIGSSFYRFLYIVLPLLITTYTIYSMQIPSIRIALFTIMSIMLAFLLSFTINFLMALLAFGFTEVWGFEFIKNTIVYFCSGAFVPLWLFPDFLLSIIKWLPFQGLNYIPLSIYIGKFNENEIMTQLSFQLGWIISLALLGKLLLHVANRRLVITGG